jgi:hypothetical protein
LIPCHGIILIVVVIVGRAAIWGKKLSLIPVKTREKALLEEYFLL